MYLELIKRTILNYSNIVWQNNLLSGAIMYTKQLLRDYITKQNNTLLILRPIIVISSPLHSVSLLDLEAILFHSLPRPHLAPISLFHVSSKQNRKAIAARKKVMLGQKNNRKEAQFVTNSD